MFSGATFNSRSADHICSIQLFPVPVKENLPDSIHDLVAFGVTTKVNLIHGKKNAHSSGEFSGEWAFCAGG